MSSFFTPAVWQGQKLTMLPRLPECGKCGLFRKCISPKMQPSGRGKRSILFVGEAPGAEEDERGTQLIGKNGQYLRNVLKKKCDTDLDDCHKTNSIICHPPESKILPLHVECCRPNLVKAVRELKPRVIVLLGGSAVRGMLPTEREADVGAIGRWVGWTIPSYEHNAWICPTYHPSYLLRMNDKVLDRLFTQHLEQAVKLENVPVTSTPLDELKKQVECITNPRLARKRVKELADKKGILAFDYEANRLKPDHPKGKIVACSFCLDGEDTFSVLVDDEMMPCISKVLRNPKLKKIASNLKNEERWTLAKMGHPVARWWFDTMLAAHVLDNRPGITSLKFQSFVHFGISDYGRTVELYFRNVGSEGFNRIEDCPKDELLSYNGLDSLLEYRLAMLQRKRMGIT